ncbi:MAG: TIGR03936 family radical SAM-associated protein, partial [Clostridiales bacterium]|nr:TIGR03936 family radical SAM-associated protein [Clostridiales bacterium]
MITIKYKKIGNAVYVSHIDTLRTVIRSIRRAGLSISYSQGFNPHPELYLSPPLPLFVESEAEYFSVDAKESAEDFLIRYAKSAVS